MSICYTETVKKNELRQKVMERDDFGWGFFIGKSKWGRPLTFF